MKKEIILCDRCGSEDAQTVSIFTNRRMDGAGSMENNYEYIDLCHDCALAILERCTKLLQPSDREWIITEMRKKVQP